MSTTDDLFVPRGQRLLYNGRGEDRVKEGVSVTVTGSGFFFALTPAPAPIKSRLLTISKIVGTTSRLSF